MRNYLIKTPILLKAIYNRCVWHVNEHANSVYITFDDGPHPTITPWVLAELKKYNAKATFFCIGKNVEAYPDIYQQIIAEGHQVGNHTHNHLNGWKVSNTSYFNNIKKAKTFIQSTLFRPPYGRITLMQAKGIQRLFPGTQIVMWDVLSGDFDTAISPQDCLENVIQSSTTGSIIVFHDSEKAYPRLVYTLPAYLKYCQQRGWKMKKLNF